MNSNDIKTVTSLLHTPKSIVIVPHKNPDGDAMGSTLALCKYLKSQGHDATVVAPNEYPHFLKWLPGQEDVIIYNATTKAAIEKIESADLIFTLDFNDLSRTGDMEQVLTGASADFIMIDHHQQPSDYAVVTYSDTRMSSTCEMVYHFLDALDVADHIDADIASCLYTGIMTDTGSFRFPSTTAVTHEVIAKLITAGADNARIHRNIYDTNSHTKLQLLGVALQNLRILPEYKTAYITLSQKELDDHNFQKGDTEGFVNYGLSLEEIIFAVIFIENKSEGIIKMSLRSIGNFSVNEFARTHYEGGGHTNAAGGKSDLSLEDTVTQFISILPRYKDKL